MNEPAKSLATIPNSIDSNITDNNTIANKININITSEFNNNNKYDKDNIINVTIIEQLTNTENNIKGEDPLNETTIISATFNMDEQKLAYMNKQK